jgi:hypothetical protein
LQRVQIRRIERDVFETEELARRCLRILSGGDTGADEEGSGGSGSDSGGGGGIRRRRRSGGGGGRRSRSISLPPVASARSVSRVGVGEVVMEEKESGKVRGDNIDGPPVERRERDRDRDRRSRFEVVRPERDASGRIVVDVGGPVDVERRRDRDRDRPAPVYVERERTRYGDQDRDRYR